MTDERKTRGLPLVCFRLEAEAIRLLRERAGLPEDAYEGGSHMGRAGGVALYIRRLVYEHLGLPMPRQFGDLGRSSKRRVPSGGKKGWPKGKARKRGQG